MSGTDNMQGSRRAQLEDYKRRDKHASSDVRLLLLKTKLFITTNLVLEDNLHREAPQSVAKTEKD